MVVLEFPPVEYADEESGLLALGGDLEVETLLLAYSKGIFPWPLFPNGELAWFAPSERALLFLKNFHVSRSLEKKRRLSSYSFRIDTAFERVVRACAEGKTRKGPKGTWITQEIVAAYIALHKAGFSHSVECFSGEELVGGLYGVSIGGMFAGESMFFLEPDASKLALCYLVDHLRERGAEWIDCQQQTSLLSQFGAVEIPRGEFEGLLVDAIRTKVTLF